MNKNVSRIMNMVTELALILLNIGLVLFTDEIKFIIFGLAMYLGVVIRHSQNERDGNNND